MAFLASSSLTFVFENNFDKCSQSIPDKSIELVLISNQHLYGDKIGIYVRHCNYGTVSRTLNTKNWCHLLRNGTESIFFHRALFPFNSPFNFKSVPKWVACLRFVADISWSSKRTKLVLKWYLSAWLVTYFRYIHIIHSTLQKERTHKFWSTS